MALPYCGDAQLHRYLHEFAFRYNHRTALGVSDNARTIAPLKGIEGKRLTYRLIVKPKTLRQLARSFGGCARSDDSPAPQAYYSPKASLDREVDSP